MVLNRTIAVSPVHTFDPGPFNNVTQFLFNATVNGTTANATETAKTPEWTNVLYEFIYLYMDAFPYAFFVIFAIPFAMAYVSTGSLKMSGVVGIITCMLGFALLPPSIVVFGTICIAFSVGATVWGVFKE